MLFLSDPRGHVCSLGKQFTHPKYLSLLLFHPAKETWLRSFSMVIQGLKGFSSLIHSFNCISALSIYVSLQMPPATKFKLILLISWQMINQEIGYRRKEQYCYLESQQTEKMVDQCPREQSYQSQNSDFFYTKKGSGLVADYCKLLDAGILCSYSCPSRSDHNVSVTRQLLFSQVLKSFLCLCEWENVIPLKGRALRMGSTMYFRVQATFFYKRYRASMAKPRQQSTALELKEYIQYEVYSSLRFVLLCYILSATCITKVMGEKT